MVGSTDNPGCSRAAQPPAARPRLPRKPGHAPQLPHPLRINVVRDHPVADESHVDGVGEISDHELGVNTVPRCQCGGQLLKPASPTGDEHQVEPLFREAVSVGRADA